MNGIQLDANYDVIVKVVKDSSGLITSGLVIGDILAQNQALIIGCYQGEFKESPLVGVGISDMLLDNDPLSWRTKIREQLEIDGQTVNGITITNLGINVDAKYETP